MTRGFLSGVLLCGLALGPSRGRATPQGSNQASNGDYLYDEKTLQVAHGDPERERSAHWQVWLYTQNVRSSGGSAYGRWGAVQGPSAEEVIKQLSLWQNFERSYTNFFGPAAWGKLTFSHPVGPIAMSVRAEAREPSALVAEADDLNRRIGVVVAAILPSLENNQNSDSSSSAAGYFRQVRDCLLGVVKFSDQVARLAGQTAFLKLELARLRDEVRHAEDGAPKITEIMPSVKLPATRSWMTQTEYQGSDGTVETTIAEIGAAAWIRRTWSGGDGTMTGAVMVTVVPYQEIGTVRVIAPFRNDRPEWTLSIEPRGHAGFPLSITSPARATSKRSFAPVDIMVSEPFLFLHFSSSGDAQDAYAFFLYHKQLGR